MNRINAQLLQALQNIMVARFLIPMVTASTMKKINVRRLQVLQNIMVARFLILMVMASMMKKTAALI